MLGQKLYTSAVPPCLTLLRPLSLYVNTKVLLTQTSASYLHKEPFPLFGSPSEAHSHLFRIPAHTRRRLSEMLTQELLTLLHRFTTVNCNTAEPWCQGDRSKFSKSAEYLGDEQKKTVVKLQNITHYIAFSDKYQWKTVYQISKKDFSTACKRDIIV